jgi:multiple sugar transport system permease protein
MRRATLSKYRKLTGRTLQILVTIVIMIFFLWPLYWTLVTSFKALGTEYRLPPEFWPSRFTLQAYRGVLGMPSVSQAEEEQKGTVFSRSEQVKGPNFLIPLRNSMIVSSLAAIVGLLMSSLSAYAIARLRFRYKIQALLLLQLGGIVPPIVVIAPVFALLKAVGLLQTLLGMIIPYSVYSVPVATWLLASYFAELPFELEDAAKLDGYKPLQIFWRVILPLSGPGLFSAGVFAFLGAWGDFMLASTVTMGLTDVQTVPVAIMNFNFQFRYQWTWMSAAVVLSIALVVSIAFAFQSRVIKGLTAGAVKY